MIELPKTEEGLGFNVMGGKEQSCPVYVSRIIPNGIAARDNRLKRGDILLSVNGQVSCFVNKNININHLDVLPVSLLRVTAMSMLLNC